ncbi:hypothetical protein L9F63_024932, partial [Diploptera punctata]
ALIRTKSKIGSSLKMGPEKYQKLIHNECTAEMQIFIPGPCNWARGMVAMNIFMVPWR